jgi:hypothetical protein
MEYILVSLTSVLTLLLGFGLGNPHTLEILLPPPDAGPAHGRGGVFRNWRFMSVVPGDLAVMFHRALARSPFIHDKNLGFDANATMPDGRKARDCVLLSLACFLRHGLY